MKDKGKRGRAQAIIHNRKLGSEPGTCVFFRNAATSARGFVACKGIRAVGKTGNRGARLFPFPYHELHKKAVKELNRIGGCTFSGTIRERLEIA